eukprot:Nitzschia sp. Nitz4//scaffold332_size19022//7107//8519//NITZ4_008740-RA/size19022-processed-gene-0.21-mRNA-1//-1//CDS//3329548201//7375//frame0
MRTIPTLQTLCLRTIGDKACKPEETFAPSKKDSKPSTASRLLRSFAPRGVEPGDKEHDTMENDNNDTDVVKTRTIQQLPMTRIPAIGKGSARRQQANDVDLNHPWVAVRETATDALVAEYNTPALDLLQSYIDSLVELSRMDDARLGKRFFLEWAANVQAKRDAKVDDDDNNNNNEADADAATRPAKRSKLTVPRGGSAATTVLLGSLSLYNATIQQDTIKAMVDSKMTQHLAVLDLTGIPTLTDAMIESLATQSPQLRRLSVKNCRRLTHKTLECLATHVPLLTSLDVGGAYNIQPTHVLELVASLVHLNEIHASGLLWTDDLLVDLTALRSYSALSLGYLLPQHVTPQGLKQALMTQTSSLTSLALPFCEPMVDAAFLGILGRHLPLLTALDVRGNGPLTSLTGWYDGRATIQPVPDPQPLFVLARYSGLTNPNIEDTKRVHPLQAMELNCCLGSEGVGMGIQRVQTP